MARNSQVVGELFKLTTTPKKVEWNDKNLTRGTFWFGCGGEGAVTLPIDDTAYLPMFGHNPGSTPLKMELTPEKYENVGMNNTPQMQIRTRYIVPTEYGVYCAPPGLAKITEDSAGTTIKMTLLKPDGQKDYVDVLLKEGENGYAEAYLPDNPENHGSGVKWLGYLYKTRPVPSQLPQSITERIKQRFKQIYNCVFSNWKQ